MNNQKMMEAEHSNIIGGSTAARRINCPASYGHEIKYKDPNDSGSEYAAEGTALHAAMEYHIKVADVNTSLESQVGNLLSLVFGDYTMTQALIDDKLLPACRAVDEIMVECGGEVDLMFEVKASLGVLIPGAFGTIDLLIKAANRALWVIDYKFGDGVKVEVEGDYQTGFYAGCALYDKDPEVMDLVGEGDFPIVLCIIQPRRGHDEPVWTKWETTTDWVEDLIDLAVDAVDKAQSPNAAYVVGSHCRWCIKHECPSHQAGVVATLDAAPPSTMDEITLASWLEKLDMYDQFSKDLRAHAHKEAERGVRIPGYKCVPKRPRRVYANANSEAAVEKLLKRRLKVEGAYTRKLLSPAQAETALGKKDYAKLVAPHVVSVSSGTTLARSTDKRPDVGDASLALAGKLKGIQPPRVKAK